VRQGEIIGYVGRTEAGQSSARAQAGRPITPHLHLEIHQKADPHVNPNNPKRINPEKYLQLKNLSPFDEHV
jgi:murein DD-endopeptidase MepM/ murein hydrolase activator NlpD